MRVFTCLASAAVMCFTLSSASADPLTDGDYEKKFYQTAQSALDEALGPHDDAAYAHLFYVGAHAALSDVLATPDDAVYARDFYNAARKALEEHGAPVELVQAVN